MPDGYKVEPEDVRGAGDKVVDAADALHNNISVLDGTQDGGASANRGFACAAAAAQCETGWEQALRAIGGKIAVAGDTLSLNAASYAGTEGVNTNRFGPN
jgi:hypothetical protein